MLIVYGPKQTGSYFSNVHDPSETRHTILAKVVVLLIVSCYSHFLPVLYIASAYMPVCTADCLPI